MLPIRWRKFASHRKEKSKKHYTDMAAPKKAPIKKASDKLDPKQAKANALTQALSNIEKNYGRGAIMKLGDEAVEKVDVIPSGSIGLNYALGVGGYPKGRIVEIYGPESSGKTTLALHAIAEAQRKGGIAAMIDAEHAFDRFYAEKLGVDPEKIFCVSIMPCIAKKDECTWDGGKDVDAVLTTREVERMFKAFFIKPEELGEDEFDDPLGSGTGAGVIFGATGGVMEAALRSAYFLVTGKNPEADAFQSVRGLDGWKEAKFNLAGTDIRVAVASGLGNARRLMNAIRNKEVHYDFVEIMSCPGGCINGGGQPYKEDASDVEARKNVLYGLDRHNSIRFSHENPSVQACYKEYFEKPLSHRAHELLHVEE